MSLVSGRFLADFLHVLALEKIDVEGLVGDLPIDWTGGGAGTPLVEWDEFCQLMARLERTLGGPEALEELGQNITNIRPAATLRRLASLATSPQSLYEATQRWGLGRAIPGLETVISPGPKGRLHITSKIGDDDTPCPELFHLATGAARSLPRILDLPSAVVSSEIGPRTAQLNVLLPPSGTLLARTRRRLRSFFSAHAALKQLELQQLEMQDHFDALHRSYSQLQASEARQRALADSLMDTMAELSPDGRFVFVSPSIESLTGYRAHQVIGSHLSLWLEREDADAGKQLLQEILQRGRTPDPSPVLRVRHQDRRTVWVEITARTFNNSEGELHTVAVLRDVSHRVTEAEALTRHQALLEEMVVQRTRQLERRNRDLRQLQSLLLEAERESAARDIADHLAHSINDPLSALIESLDDAIGIQRADPQSLEHMLQLAHRMADVVRRTLELCRNEKLERHEVDPGELMSALESELKQRAESRGVKLTCNVDPSLGVFCADQSLLLSGLLSVAEHTLDAMRDGGTLGVEIEGVAAGHASNPVDDAVRIEIWNTGPGIPKDVRDQVFRTLFSSEAGGVGLGLAIAQSVIAGHHGRIRIGDRPGGGSTITIEIPSR